MDVYQRRRLVALSGLAGIFIVIVLLVRSCGGDDEETPQPLAGATSGATGVGGPLSREAYIAQADEICRQINTAISEIATTDANAAADERGTDIASELDQLQSIPAPTDGQEQLNDFLQALQDQVDSYEKRSLAVERGDDAAVAELDAKIAAAEEDAEQAARRFGFEACGDFSETGETGGGGGGGGAAETDTATDETATGGAAVTTTPVTPTTTTPVTPAPETDTGTAAPETETAPPTDTGTETDPTGGVTP